MPFGPYANFDDCVAKNADKASPQGFCAWLHKQITGAYPSQMETGLPAEAWEVFMAKYEGSLNAGKGEREAYEFAVKEGLEPAGWVNTARGWSRLYQTPKMRTVAGVKVFATGTHTDSAGLTREWTEADLDNMVTAFVAGVPAISPLKCGHTPDSFNRKIAEALDVPVEVVTGLNGQGQVALGRMSSLERKGNLLVAAYERVPDPIASLIEAGLFSTVSVEIDDKVGDFGPVITATALLGAEEPAVSEATLARTSVFGKPREGARVLSFRVGHEIPAEELRKEFADVRNRLAEVIKGKRGAPIFRAMFASLNEMFERLLGSGKHQTGENAEEIPEELLTYAASAYQGNVQGLIDWAAGVGFDGCVAHLTGKPGITDPERVCGWLKGRAHSKNKEETGTMSLKISEYKAKFQEPGMAPEGADAAAALMAIATALGLTEGATVEDIIAAITALGEKAAGAAPAEGAAAAPGAMGAEFSKMSATIKAQGDTIASLQHEARVEKFQKITSTFKAIEGKPEDLAADLATLEEKAGADVAERAVKAYQAAEKANAAALKATGTARSGAKAAAFEDKVQEFMKADPKLNRGEATKRAMQAHPDLYREVKQDAHAGSAVV